MSQEDCFVILESFISTVLKAYTEIYSVKSMSFVPLKSFFNGFWYFT